MCSQIPASPTRPLLLWTSQQSSSPHTAISLQNYIYIVDVVNNNKKIDLIVFYIILYHSYRQRWSKCREWQIIAWKSVYVRPDECTYGLMKQYRKLPEGRETDVSHSRACEWMTLRDVRSLKVFPFRSFVRVLCSSHWAGKLFLWIFCCLNVFTRFAHKRLHLPLDLNLCCWEVLDTFEESMFTNEQIMMAEDIATIPFFNFCKIQLKNFILAQPIYLWPKLMQFFLYCTSTRCWYTSYEKRSLNLSQGRFKLLVNYFCRTLPLQLTLEAKRKAGIIIQNRQNTGRLFAFFFNYFFSPSLTGKKKGGKGQSSSQKE